MPSNLRRVTQICGAILWASLASGQGPSQIPRFDVAAIHRYDPDSTNVPGQGFTSSPEGIRATHVTVRGCLQWAFGIAEVSGPRWIMLESYDIVAKVGTPVSDLELHGMMQELLRDRFHLRLHIGNQELPVNVLVVAKKGVRNLDPVAAGQPFEIKRSGGRLEIKNAPMSRIAGVLGSPLGNMPLESVRDQTGLTGLYSVTLDLNGFDPKDPFFSGNYEDMRAALSAFVSESLERQYGLRLERRKLPVETLVVDSGEKIPLQN